jgi:hypothetical protein
MQSTLLLMDISTSKPKCPLMEGINFINQMMERSLDRKFMKLFALITIPEVHSVMIFTGNDGEVLLDV